MGGRQRRRRGRSNPSLTCLIYADVLCTCLFVTDDIIAFAGSVVFVLVVVAITFWHNHKKASNKAFDFASEIEDLRRQNNIGDGFKNRNIPREIKRKYIRKIDTLGKGNFGEVRTHGYSQPPFGNNRVPAVRVLYSGFPFRLP